MDLFGAGQVIGSAIDAGANIYAQHSARVASENMYRQRYQIMVNDLKKAGLNPMLAYMKDAGTPPSVGGGQVSNGFSGAFMRAEQAKQASAQAQLLKDQSLVAQSQADLNSATAAKTRAETLGEGQYWQVKDSERMRNEAQGWHADALAAQVKRMLPSLAGKADAEKEIAELSIEHYRNLNEYEKTRFRKQLGVMSEDIQRLSSSAHHMSDAINPLKVLKFLDGMDDEDNARRGGSYSKRRR